MIDPVLSYILRCEKRPPQKAKYLDTTWLFEVITRGRLEMSDHCMVGSLYRRNMVHTVCTIFRYNDFTIQQSDISGRPRVMSLKNQVVCNIPDRYGCPDRTENQYEASTSKYSIDTTLGQVTLTKFKSTLVYFDYLYVHKSTLLGNKDLQSLLKRQMDSRLTTSIKFYLTRDKSITRIIFHDFRRQVQKRRNPFIVKNDRWYIKIARLQVLLRNIMPIYWHNISA